MAFVYRSTREDVFGPSSTPGPGSYINPTQHSSQLGYAPFSTTAQRAGLTIASGSLSPGPGTYNTVSVRKQPSRSPPPFKERFAIHVNTVTPGPGAYNVLTPSRVKQPQTAYKANKGTRNGSVPSIPSAFQKYGFEETPAGDLVMQMSPIKKFSGDKRDSVGPGHYNVQPRFHSPGPTWHKSKVERALQLAKPGPGPGAYSDSLLKPATTKKFTAAFSSNVPRDSYIPTAGKLSDDSSDSDEEDNSTPGPGYYFQETPQTTTTQPSHQFLSRVPRFQSPTDESAHLGPGYYGTPKELRPKRKEVPFASSNKRFIEPPEPTPGPGTYNEPRSEKAKIRLREWPSSGAFGTTDKRFHSHVQGETPGPGHYKFNTPSKARPTASFLSTEKRLANSLKKEVPPPGAYDVPSTIGARKKTLSTQPMLMHLDAQKKPVAFESQAERFVGLKPGAVGPGSYQVLDSPQPGNSSLPKAGRFLPDSVLGPGPGTYEALPSDWTKKSFNLLFSDAL